MTQTQSDRLKDVQRQYAEMEHHTATLQNAQQAAEKAAWVTENNYRSLTDKCREEFRVRQQVLEGLKQERTFLLSLAVIAGAVGVLGAGLTSETARWLWDTFLAISASGGMRWPRGGTLERRCGFEPRVAARRRPVSRFRPSARALKLPTSS